MFKNIFVLYIFDIDKLFWFKLCYHRIINSTDTFIVIIEISKIQIEYNNIIFYQTRDKSLKMFCLDVLHSILINFDSCHGRFT